MAKILVIEKDRQLREFLADKLSGDGHQVKTAAKGLAALETVDQFRPDLVVLSSQVKDIQGESICWEIKKNYPDLTIVLLFEEVESEQIRRFFKAGADDFVVKPIQIKDLLVRIRARLTKQRQADTVLQVADLKLDTKTYTVERAGQPIKLTPREFKLLKFLMANQGRVLTREVILNRVWSYGADVESRAVDVYIGYLREKIDQDFKKKLIKTVRGFGYTIKE